MTKQNTFLTPDEGTEQDRVVPEDKNPETTSGPDLTVTEPQEEFFQEESEDNAPMTPLETEAPENKPEEQQVDYKEKFSYSTRENQLLRGKISSLEKQLGVITNDETPTDAEMRQLYPEWDDMLGLEKDLLKKTIILERRLNKTSMLVQDMVNEKNFEEKLDNFLTKASLTNEFSGLKGREKEFKEFAHKPAYKNIDLDIIAKAFLYTAGGTVSEPKPAKSALEKGSGGSRESAAQSGLTPEQIKEIREKDPKRYNLLIKQGKIKLDI